MRETALSVPVKAWAVACAILGVSLTANTLLTCLLALLAFCQLVFERRWRLFLAFGAFLSGAGAAAVSHPLSRPAYGGFLGVLCADVLQPHAGVPGGVGSHYHAAGTAFSRPVESPYPHPGYLRAAGGVSVFSNHEGGAEGGSAVHEEPKADWARAGAPSSCRHLRVCVGSLAAALPANRGPAFCIGHSAGRPGAGLAGKLLCQKEAAG